MDKSYIERSKVRWENHGEDPERLTGDQIQTGCLQRIALATEQMALRYSKLVDENKWLTNDVDFWIKEYGKLEKSNSALRGVITRMKNKVKCRSAEK